MPNKWPFKRPLHKFAREQGDASPAAWFARAVAATLAASLLLLLPASVSAGSAPAGTVPVAIDVQVTSDAAQARIAFTVSAPLEPKVSILDLPDVNFPVPTDLGRKGRGLVKSLRHGMIAPGRSRIVIELASPALPVQVTNEPVNSGAAQVFSIELKKADREAYTRSLVMATPPLPPATAPKPAPAGDRRPVVVLDAGHGGIDTGAIGISQIVEKDVVLGFTRELKARLERSGQVRVVMTRDNDVFISLGERVRLAQAQQASLFVSIHADTLTVSPEVRGLTVYTNSDRASDAESARLAETENLADSAGGIESPDAVEEVAGILGDLTRRETRSYSHLFAKTLVGQIEAASRLNKNPNRSAGFRVLRAADVPSVLVELGYLSSKSDVELLKTASWREKAADSIASSVLNFLGPRLGQQASAPLN
jgi:N-acetylmuramoyl-L-alanine amidase